MWSLERLRELGAGKEQEAQTAWQSQYQQQQSNPNQHPFASTSSAQWAPHHIAPDRNNTNQDNAFGWTVDNSNSFPGPDSARQLPNFLDSGRPPLQASNDGIPSSMLSPMPSYPPPDHTLFSHSFTPPRSQVNGESALALSPTSFFNNPSTSEQQALLSNASQAPFYSSYGAYIPVSGPLRRFLTPSPEPQLLRSLEELGRDLEEFTSGGTFSMGSSTHADAGENAGGGLGLMYGWNQYDGGSIDESSVTGLENPGSGGDPFEGMTLAGVSVPQDTINEPSEQERRSVILSLQQQQSSLLSSTFALRNQEQIEREQRERVAENFERAVRGLTPDEGYDDFGWSNQRGNSYGGLANDLPNPSANPAPPIYPPLPLGDPRQQLQNVQRSFLPTSSSPTTLPNTSSFAAMQHTQVQLQLQSQAQAQVQGQQSQSDFRGASLADMRAWAHPSMSPPISDISFLSSARLSSNSTQAKPRIPKTKPLPKKRLSLCTTTPATSGSTSDAPLSNIAKAPLKKNRNPHATQLPGAGTGTQANKTTEPGADGTGVVECHHCASTRTPLWRRGPNDELLCNACGLFLKLHGVPRPKIFATQPVGARGRTQTGAAAQAAASLTPPSCANCEVTSTPMWRKDGAGLLTCNACSLYFKLHNKLRPTSLSKKRKVAAVVLSPKDRLPPPTEPSARSGATEMSHSSPTTSTTIPPALSELIPLAPPFQQHYPPTLPSFHIPAATASHLSPKTYSTVMLSPSLPPHAGLSPSNGCAAPAPLMESQWSSGQFNGLPGVGTALSPLPVMSYSKEIEEIPGGDRPWKRVRGEEIPSSKG